MGGGGDIVFHDDNKDSIAIGGYKLDKDVGRCSHYSARSNVVGASFFVDVTGARYRLMVFSWFSAIESLVTAKFRGMILEKEGKGL